MIYYLFERLFQSSSNVSVRNKFVCYIYTEQNKVKTAVCIPMVLFDNINTHADLVERARADEYLVCTDINQDIYVQKLIDYIGKYTYSFDSANIYIIYQGDQINISDFIFDILAYNNNVIYVNNIYDAVNNSILKTKLKIENDRYTKLTFYNLVGMSNKSFADMYHDINFTIEFELNHFLNFRIMDNDFQKNTLYGFIYSYVMYYHSKTII